MYWHPTNIFSEAQVCGVWRQLCFRLGSADLIEVFPIVFILRSRMKGQPHPTGSFSHGRSLEPRMVKPKTASIALAKKFIWVFYNILQKNLNKLFSQCNLYQGSAYIIFSNIILAKASHMPNLMSKWHLSTQCPTQSHRMDVYMQLFGGSRELRASQMAQW